MVVGFVIVMFVFFVVFGKYFFKRWFFWFIVVVIVIIVGMFMNVGNKRLVDIFNNGFGGLVKSSDVFVLGG